MARAIFLAIFAMVLTVPPVVADIFRWDNGQLIPGTQGITPGPGVYLESWNSPERNLRFADFSGGLDLTQASFSFSWLDNARFNGANLTNAFLNEASLTNADLSGANLTDAELGGGPFSGGAATLTNANLAGAIVTGARFGTPSITREQLYSTASYQQKNLRGIGLSGNDLIGWNFSGQDLAGAGLSSTLTNANLSGANLTNAVLVGANLTNADLSGANLTDADLGGGLFSTGATLTNANLSGAVVTGVRFYDATSSGFTKEQLYSTANYQQRNLRGIGLSRNNLTGWDFSGQDLTGADFFLSTLTSANFAGAVVAGANFAGGFGGSGVTLPQLYSTASYQQRDLNGIDLSYNNLTGGDFSGQDLTGARLHESTLTNANLAGAILTDAQMGSATLTNANLAGAVVAGANFLGTTSRGFTREQLYSTASYQQNNLRGIDLIANNLTAWDFSGQDLTGAYFANSRLTSANLSGALVTGASFQDTTSGGFTREQLYSTASYQQRDLNGIDLSYNNLTAWDFSGQDLTGAFFSYSTLTSANFAGAVITGASFFRDTSFGGSGAITLSQLYSTASYQQRNLNGICLFGNNLTGWDFSGQDLTGADFAFSRLTSANLSGAVVTGADFYDTTSRGFTKEQLYSTASYQQRNLRGIGLSGNNLTRWDFSGQDLAGADFNSSRLTNADLSFADLRLATYDSLDGALVRNTILRDGTIDGLNLAAGERLVAYAGVPLAVKLTGDISMAPTATFDLTDNAAIINYNGTSPIATIRQQILVGRGGSGPGGDWTGTGITSSTAAAANQAQPDSRSLGYADNATLPLGAYTSFHGAAVDETSILIAYTRTGDANLDGVVNDDDVTIVGATYAPGVPNGSWALGDFDYNGFVDDDDVTLLGVFYDPSAQPFAVAASGIAATTGVASVPEPATILLASTAGLLLLLIRRRASLTVTCGAPILSSCDSPLRAGCNASGQEPSRSFG